jgi:hypothetical protein
LAKAGYGPYRWVVDQAEMLTDAAFRSRGALEALLPTLFSHAASAFSAEDVLRFLGRKLHPALAAEVASDARRRPEGWRVKHRMGRNSVKCYDKANVLRVEVTINDPTQFRVLRVKNGHRVWCPMRKGVVNLPRYYQVGRAANERYLEALATATDNRDAIRVLDRHCRPITNRGKRHPRLNPVAKEDLVLFRAALAGENLINGFSNRHLPSSPLPRAARRPRRGQAPLPAHQSAHNQTARPRPHRQGPSPAPLPRHPLRPALHGRRGRRPRQRLPQRLPQARGLRLLLNPNILAEDANPSGE